MTTSEQNKTTEMSIETTAVAKSDTCSRYLKPSNQHLYFAKWLEVRDCGILPPKESIPKSSCVRSETRQRNWSIDRRALSIHSASHRYHDDNHLKNKTLPLSSISKQDSANNLKRSASAQNPSKPGPRPSNKQHPIQEKTSQNALCSSLTTRQQKTTSRIPVRRSESSLPSFIMSSSTTYNPKSPSLNKGVISKNKQYEILQLDNHLKIKNDHNKQKPPESGINHDSNQTILVMSGDNDRDKVNIVKRETTTDADCSETIHLDIAKIEIEEENTKALPFTNIVGTLSLSNKQDNYFNDSISEVQTDNDNNSIFTALMKEQAELKAYYDSFPNIDNAMDEVGPNIKKAKEFTESILRKLPSGDVNDRDTLCHVLKNLLGTEYQECLFYDSENGITLHDASLNLADINSQDRPFVLKLNSSEGLGNRNNLQSEQDDFELVQILRNVIEQKQSHPVIEDIIERLSKAHDVNKEDIVIKTVYVGSFSIVYTVMDLSRNIIKSLLESSKKLKKQFKQFISAKIHPLLYRPSFDIAYFDDRGNKSFPGTSETHEVGPPGRTKSYITPSEWTRYGLKVLDKYSNNVWLHPFQHPGNWYRAFHGTGRAIIEDFGDKNPSFDKKHPCVDALSSIYLNDFRKARVVAYGEGVYCSPNPQFPEQGYVQAVPLDTQKGVKRFKCMLQVAVNPDGVKFTGNKDIWVVPDPKDIRPYGILIKEA